MNVEECEKVYGKLVREDENFCYFEGRGDYGITVPKHAYFSFQPERLSETEQCQHEWGSEEHEGSPTAHYICNKCNTVMR